MLQIRLFWSQSRVVSKFWVDNIGAQEEGNATNDTCKYRVGYLEHF
jgi:hypothetical protein